MLGGVVLGLLVPIGLLLVQLFLDPRIRMAGTIVTRNRVAIAAIVPHLWTPRQLRGLRVEIVLLAFVVVSTVFASGTIAYLRMTKVL